MRPVEAIARLTAQWPSIGGDNPAAEIRLEYWNRAVSAVSSETRAQAVDQLILGWRGEWPPKIADWHDTCNQLVRRRELAQPERYAIEPASVPAEQVKALIDGMRATLNAIPKRTPQRKQV